MWERPERLFPVTAEGIHISIKDGHLKADYCFLKISSMDFEEPQATLPRTEDHYGNWITACKTGSETDCPIVMGCEMTELALLGALTLRTNLLLEWDAKSMQVTNQGEDVNILVDPPYREGWEI